MPRTSNSMRPSAVRSGLFESETSLITRRKDELPRASGPALKVTDEPFAVAVTPLPPTRSTLTTVGSGRETPGSR